MDILLGIDIGMYFMIQYISAKWKSFWHLYIHEHVFCIDARLKSPESNFKLKAVTRLFECFFTN